MNFIQNFVIGILICLTCSSCHNSSSNSQKTNSIYYWRTTFTLNDSERKFLREHDVTKIYMRFFDVDYSYSEGYGSGVIPNATIQFVDSVPNNIDVVPTIYITTQAMDEIQTNEEEYAEKIIKRVNAICKRNNIDFIELQLDCDWTKGTRKPFFDLCEAIKNQLDSTKILSSTIRLHQLTQSPPPVDKGVLMVYNTGNLMEITTQNSIFSRKDIEPYLKDNRLRDYSLPLDVAYPTYGWSLVFHHSNDDTYRFDRIMRRTDFSSYPQLNAIDKNIYEATANFNLSADNEYWDWVYIRYLIKVERPTAKELIEVKKMIDRHLADKPHNNILYHLDETQLSNYTDNEISKIYSHN